MREEYDKCCTKSQNINEENKNSTWKINVTTYSALNAKEQK